MIEIILNNLGLLLIGILVLLILPLIASYCLPNNIWLKGYRNALKISLTNWINIAVIFSALYIAMVIIILIKHEINLYVVFLSPLYLVVLFGMVFWACFIACIVVMDVILFGFNKEIKHTTLKLVIEGLFISSPFIYWVIQYGDRFFLIAILAFFLGQYLRRRRIIKILNKWKNASNLTPESSY